MNMRKGEMEIMGGKERKVESVNKIMKYYGNKFHRFIGLWCLKLPKSVVVTRYTTIHTYHTSTIVFTVIYVRFIFTPL